MPSPLRLCFCAVRVKRGIPDRLAKPSVDVGLPAKSQNSTALAANYIGIKTQ
jgi:hypothetical protein